MMRSSFRFILRKRADEGDDGRVPDRPLGERIGKAANAEDLGAMALEEPAGNECPQLEHETSSMRESKRRPGGGASISPAIEYA